MSKLYQRFILAIPIETEKAGEPHTHLGQKGFSLRDDALAEARRRGFERAHITVISVETETVELSDEVTSVPTEDP